MGRLLREVEVEVEEEGLGFTALPLSHRASWSAADGLSPPPSSSLRPGTFFSSCYLETAVELWVKDPPSAAALSTSRLAPSCCCW